MQERAGEQPRGPGRSAERWVWCRRTAHSLGEKRMDEKGMRVPFFFILRVSRYINPVPASFAANVWALSRRNLQPAGTQTNTLILLPSIPHSYECSPLHILTSISSPPLFSLLALPRFCSLECGPEVPANKSGDRPTDRPRISGRPPLSPRQCILKRGRGRD